MTTAAAMRAEALAQAARGDDAAASRLFARAVAAFPRDAALLNSAGNYHAGAGRPTEALALFDRALAVLPGFGEAAINRGVVLTRLDRAGEAADELARNEAALGGLPRYWTTRAAAEIATGRLAAAAASYDAGLARAPHQPRALHGRARIALDRGETGAITCYERALAVSPGDPELLLGLTQALEAVGERDAALALAARLVAHLPGWIDGLELYATLRWAAGDRTGFCAHYAPVGSNAARDAAIDRSWARMLAGVDAHADAADVLARARIAWPDDPGLALSEAICRGEAGDDAGAAALFARWSGRSPDWLVGEGRHVLRTGDPGRAERLLAAALAARAGDVDAWGLRDLCWRMQGDARHTWLHGQDGMIQNLPLDLSDTELAAACKTLDALHDRAAMPIGQSVKHGSQTRGALFQRTEPAIATIAAAVTRAMERYRAALPVPDPAHPLLRWRERAWQVAGSWSIRLEGKGRHAAHIHPAGILSSAAYFAVPPAPAGPGGDERAGWLELGRPPANLRLDLPPLAVIRPRPGHCVLFPSTLYHGTRPIAGGKRMTVAFDVAAR